MRDLIECQAEVFRRSEKRIKARRTRTIRTLAICVPLVLCLTAIPFLSGGFPGVIQDHVVTDPAIHTLPGGPQLSYICPVSQITVSGPDFSRSITEVSDILSLSNRLLVYDTYCAGSGAITNETAQDDSVETADTYAQDITLESVTTGYTVTLVMHDGTKTAYSLAGSILRNLSTGQEYVLPQQEAENLAQLLGLPQ